MSLIRKTTRGLFWVSFSTVLLKVINFILTIILARLLEPGHFGLVAIGLIIVNFFEIFRDLGIGTALIYKKDSVDKAANTAFFLFPMFAVIFYVVSYLIAPSAAYFFNEPEVEAIIRALSFIFVIGSFWALPNSLLDKNLEFKKKIIPQVVPKIGYGIVAISLALNGFGVWSLVIGRLALEMLSVLAIWFVVDWRPSYRFDTKTASELISYGRQVVGANILLFLISIIDVTFIGRLLGADNLGFYAIALGIANLFASQVSIIVDRVMFPVYSTIQDNRTALKKAYIRTIKYVSLISIPATFGIFIIAEDFIKVVYGDKWLPAVAALQVLCFYGLSWSLISTTENLYLAAGKPEVRTKFKLLQLILMSVLMYPLTMRYGIFGASIAAMLPSTLIMFLTFREAGKIIDESFAYIAKSFVPGIKGSLVLILAIYAWQYVSDPYSPILRLSFSIILGSSVYITSLWLIRRDLFLEIKDMITRR
ncbi:MAG: lipopolysaccharide biosynthesis protein [Candidatus Methanoperedens sp.]|nr:lipopolysaccharide biosynthesis protein [Candidatus Methanoperedens nitroreducens]MDJ1420745.1 lipopolysaccharide biosynthesis protein [Candidatus Methanoperedens sp.]